MHVVQISKTKIDQLGDRLRKGNITEDDLRLLDEYRRSFTAAYESIVSRIRTHLGLEPTGRPAKSTTAISEKLRRESIRLSQIQDIAGCRLVVLDIANQERIKSSLGEIFPDCLVMDRREKPSHGYRAIHVIATVEGRSVEIQLRTALQQAWAELSEKLADVFDPAIKYGGGKEAISQLLSKASLAVTTAEMVEIMLLEGQQDVDKILSEANLTEELRHRIMNLQERMASLKASMESNRKTTLDTLRHKIQEITAPLEKG